MMTLGRTTLGKTTLGSLTCEATRTCRRTVAISTLLTLTWSPLAWAQPELWVTPPTWVEPTVIDTDNDRMRDDYLDNVADATKWPELLGQSTTWRSFMNITRDFNLWPGISLPPLTDAELEQLVGFTNDHGLLVAFETGGLRLAPGQDPLTAGEEQAAREIPLLQRWLAADSDGDSMPDGRLDLISADHPVLISFNKMNDDPSIPSMTMAEIIRELVDYYQAMQTAFPGIKMGLLEGPTAFEVATDAGFVYSPNSTAIDPPVRFRDFWSDLLAEMANRGLTLDHFLTDAGPQAPRFDGGNDDSWDFGRLIDVERHIQSTGVRHGLLVHPGIDYNMVVLLDEAEANRGAYDITLRYAEEFRAAGGAPDIYAPASWHNYPTLVGPEDVPFTWLNLARDVVALDTIVREKVIVPYLSDDFEQNSLGSRWSAGPGWQILGGVLSQTQTSGNRLTELMGETLGDLVIRATLKLTPGANGWAGVHFRKQSGDLAWHSGYTVYVRPSGLVSLYAPGGVLATFDAGLDPTLEAVDLRVEAIEDRLRVFVNSVEGIDLIDSTYTSGVVSLDTVNQAAEYDDVQLSRYPVASLEFEDDFASGSLGPWVDHSGSWAVDNEQLHQSATVGLAQIGRGPALASSRVATRIKLGPGGSGWAGVTLRRANPSAAPWTEGYTVYLRPNGTVTLYKPQTELQIVDTELDLSEYVDLEVVAEDHRLVISVGGRQLISEWDENFALGSVGLISLSQEAWFDDVVVDSLSE